MATYKGTIKKWLSTGSVWDILYPKTTMDQVINLNTALADMQSDIESKPPNSHASTGTSYGVGTTANYGHVKTINALTQNSHINGTALSAYQGYLLNNAIAGKEPSIGTKGSAFNKNFGTTSGTVCQGNDSRLSNNRNPNPHTHDVDEIEPVLSTVTSGHTYSNNLKPNSTVVIDSTTNLYCYLDNIADTGTYKNQWKIGDTLTVIRLGTGSVRLVDSAGTLYVNNEGTPTTGGYIYLPRYTAVTCIMVSGTTSATNWVILGATSTSSSI